MNDYSWKSNPWVWALTFRRVNEPPSGKPIPFNGPMVRAILRKENPKTQDRRVIVPQPPQPSQRFGDIEECERYPGEWFQWDGGERGTSFVCPYGKHGDRLYVRECFLLDERNRKGKVPQEVIYDATPEWAMNHRGEVERVRFIDGSLVSPEAARISVSDNRFWHKKPSIHMPKWASRITLEITEVRVQRLQEISEADAIAEGFPLPEQINNAGGMSAGRHFEYFWDDTNAKRGPKRGKVAA